MHICQINKPFGVEPNQVKCREVVRVIGFFNTLDYQRQVMTTSKMSTSLDAVARSGPGLLGALLVHDQVVLDRVEELQRLRRHYPVGKSHQSRTTKPVDQIHILTLIPVEIIVKKLLQRK